MSASVTNTNTCTKAYKANRARLPADIRDTSLLIRVLNPQKCKKLPYPDIVELPPEIRKKWVGRQVLEYMLTLCRLLYGFQVKVVMYTNEGELKSILPNGIAIRALVALSTVINRAFFESPFQTDTRQLERVILPHGNIEAYKMLFDGLEATYKEGKVNSFEIPANAPLFHIWHLREIARKLDIRHIFDETERIYESLCSQPPDKSCSIDPNDIKFIYRDFDSGHALRKAIVEKVAWGIMYGQLDPTSAVAIHLAEEEIKDFRMELAAREHKIQADGGWDEIV